MAQRLLVVAHAATSATKALVFGEPGGAKSAGFGERQFVQRILEYLRLVSHGEIGHRQFVEQIQMHAYQDSPALPSRSRAIRKPLLPGGDSC